jgi:N-methylhydantoinase B/oxoprolinase/acetone carboxylase alpha subunit
MVGIRGSGDSGIRAAREILGTGAAGAVGKGRLLRAAGGMEEIGATASFKVEAGDVLTLMTPGGGGFGGAGFGDPENGAI